MCMFTRTLTSQVTHGCSCIVGRGAPAWPAQLIALKAAVALPAVLPRCCTGSSMTPEWLPSPLLLPTFVTSPAGYPPGSLFHGRELPRQERVVTEWGQHSLVDAGG